MLEFLIAAGIFFVALYLCIYAFKTGHYVYGAGLIILLIIDVLIVGYAIVMIAGRL
jgi:hypothetical protein